VAATCARDPPVAPAADRRSDSAVDRVSDRTNRCPAVATLEPWRTRHRCRRHRRAPRRALDQSGAGRDRYVRATHRCGAQALEAGSSGEAGEPFIQLAALGLVLDGVEAVIQGRLRLVPLDATAPDGPQSPKEAGPRIPHPCLPYTQTK